MKPRLKTFLIWTTIIAVFVIFSSLLQKSNNRITEFHEFEDFLQDVAAERVAEVWIGDNEIVVRRFGQETRYRTVGELSDKTISILEQQEVEINWGSPADDLPSHWVTLLSTILPLAILIGLFIFFLKRSGLSSTSHLMALGRSRARAVSEESKIMFTDVGGCEEAKRQLEDIVDFLKHPDHWKNVGARLPRGVLLEGPPGSGKTLLARAIAGETKAHFFYVAASEFVELFVGVGAARVRDMFDQAKKDAPAVIFIDELDALGRRRGSGVGAGHDEREQTLNQLLVCLDGFESSDRVVVIGATNRADVLDSALLRPGRFDRRIALGSLSPEARKEVLRIHTAKKRLAASFIIDQLVGLTEGMNGADIESLTNEAALLAVRRTRGTNGKIPEIEQIDFDQALEQLKKRSRVFSKLDAVLIESASQLARPLGPVAVRIIVRDGEPVEGDILWADATFVKVLSGDKSRETLVAKSNVIRLEVLGEGGLNSVEDISVDAWARHRPDLA